MPNSTWEWRKATLILTILPSPDAEEKEGRRDVVSCYLPPFIHSSCLYLPSLPPDASCPSKHLIKRSFNRSVSIPSLRWTLTVFFAPSVPFPAHHAPPHLPFHPTSPLRFQYFSPFLSPPSLRVLTFPSLLFLFFLPPLHVFPYPSLIPSLPCLLSSLPVFPSRLPYPSRQPPFPPSPLHVFPYPTSIFSFLFFLLISLSRLDFLSLLFFFLFYSTSPLRLPYPSPVLSSPPLPSYLT